MDRKKSKQFLSIVVLAGVALMLWGCPKSADVTSSPESQSTPSAAEAEAGKQAEAQKAAETAAKEKQAEEALAQERAAKSEELLKPVYFEYDRSVVRDDARKVMRANAAYLKANPKIKVRIEGNCDERGTVEYNQALGQRRAANTKKYLNDLGISNSRISLISYGKEKPSCQESNEECWQKNRRADLVPVSE